MTKKGVKTSLLSYFEKVDYIISNCRLIAFLGVFSFFLLKSVSAQNIDINDLTLAGKYFQDGEFEKAADLYLRIYDASLQPVYFTIFLNCMIELKDFERAEKEIKKISLYFLDCRPIIRVQYFRY